MKQLLLLTLTFLLLNSTPKAQTCGTPIPTNPTIYSSAANARGASSSFCIDVFFHIVRNTDGSSAFTPTNPDDIVADLNEFYSPHNIIVNNAGSGFINNSAFVNIDNQNEATTLGQTNNQSNAINYYIVETLWNVGNGFIAGTANSIPSNNLVIRNDRTLSSTSPHELGHCLNLLHTHETAEGVEAIDGSNCSNAGDLICDTPADPRLIPGTNVNFNCTYIGNDGYNPLTNNLMSYSYSHCRDEFTTEQGLRMRTAISEEPLLQNITGNTCASISTADIICHPNTITITLSNLNGATTTWTSSGTVHITSSNNSSATFQAASSSTSGAGWIRASLSNGIVFTEEFWVGKPSTPVISGPQTVSAGSLNYYTASPWTGIPSFEDQEVTSIQWSFPLFPSGAGWNCYNCNAATNPVTAGNQSTYVSVKTSNACGVSTRRDYAVNVPQDDCPPRGCIEPFFVYPNPSSTSLLIESSENEDINYYEIYNLKSELMLKGEFKTQASIDVSSLKKGRYLLKIINSSQTDTQHIIIN